MYGVNLDLLRTGPHHPDGRPKDPHAHHGADLRARLRATRHQRWLNRIARLRNLLARHAEPATQACPDPRP